MGLLSKILLSPIRAPITGPVWVAGQIAKAAEAQHSDPAALRAALAEAEQQLLAGELSEEDYDQIEEDLLRRLQDASR